MIKSYAKINISLSVLNKVNSNLHKIESLITFINLYDKIFIKEIRSKDHKISFYGRYSKEIPKTNTIFNLLEELDKVNLLKNKKYQIKIYKKIPLEAGLGGGSMNSASILDYFIKKKKIRINRKNLRKLIMKIGSDVIIGMHNSPIIIKGSKIINLKKKVKLYIVLFKPSFGCTTKKIYNNVKIYNNSSIKKLKNNYTDFNFLTNLNNDLEKVAFTIYPKLNNYKKYILKLPMVLFARMTGSGSSLIGYFNSKKASINAAKILKKKFKNNLCISSKTI